MDYGAVRPDLGTMDDLHFLATALHESGMSLTVDLVLNHVAYEHEWAARARAGEPRYRDYFWTFDDRTGPDAFESTLNEVFPATAPGNFTWNDEVNGWVWTTFNSWQWDLNWANPDVFCEFAEIILNLANQGVDCLRLDAIAFLWKRLGSIGQNEPEVHLIAQALRAMTHIAAPATIFKAEAIVGPKDLVAYLGRGEQAGRVSDLAYHNSLMAQIWSTMATRDANLLGLALSQVPPIPVTTAWVTYLRCHDDIGWAIDDGDAAALGLSGAAHRSFLADFYSGQHEASFAEGMIFQENPLSGDRRNSGTAASLLGVGRARTPEDLDEAIGRYLCAYAMVFGFGGIPLIYMGDELGLTNDYEFAQIPEHADDNRWLHRPEMPWDVAESLGGRPESASARINLGMRRLIDVRKRLESFHAAVTTEVRVMSPGSILCFVRRHPAGDMVQVYNVSDAWQSITRGALDDLVPDATFDELAGHEATFHSGTLWLAPYASLWLTCR